MDSANLCAPKGSKWPNVFCFFFTEHLILQKECKTEWWKSQLPQNVISFSQSA